MRVQRDVEKLEKDAEVKGKTKDGKEFSFKGISAAQVVARAKDILFSHGVLYLPEQDKDSIRIDGNKTSMWVVGRFENIDDPEDFIERGAWGAGTDNADNNYAKAFTNADKQILSKTLRMTTVEYASDEQVPHQPEGTREALNEAKRDNDAALRSWANALKTALTKATTVEEIDDIQAEARETLMAKSTPENTRTFFIQMIEKRKKLLGGDIAAS